MLVTLIASILTVGPVDTPDGLILVPYLQNPAPDAITVMWETEEPCIGSVAYAAGPSALFSGFATVVKERRPRTIHQVRLTGLTPGTEYLYLVESGTYTSELKSLHTAPAPGVTTARLGIYGDNRSNPDVHTAVALGMEQADCGLIINGGDLVGAGSKLEQWKPEFFDPLASLIDEVPIITVAGNHEQESPNYYNRVDLPNNEKWFSLDYAGIHIIGLNSCLAGGEDSDQFRWLLDDLRSPEALAANWILVSFHHPPFAAHPTRGIFGHRNLWHEAFETHGVDLVINGHDHYYHRSKWMGGADDDPDTGVVYIVTGGGGAPCYPSEDKPYSVYHESVHHYMIADFTADTLSFVTYNLDGEVIDQAVIEEGVAPAEDTFDVGDL